MLHSCHSVTNALWLSMHCNLAAKCFDVSLSLALCAFSKYSSAWIRHACLYQWRLIRRQARKADLAADLVWATSLQERFRVPYWGLMCVSACFPPQKPPRTQRARRITRRRALNSASEKTGRTTTTRRTLLNSLKWSITAAMGRARGASALREWSKWPQTEFKCELIKKKWDCVFCCWR